jgi:hypothetical protein
LQLEFAAAEADIEHREAALKSALAEISMMLGGGIGESVLDPSHALARFMTDFNTKLVDIGQNWLNHLGRYDRNTTFRKGFTDSLVVFVLGKVKAGKSSLGNYMAYGRSNPEGEHIANDQPQKPYFFTAAMARGAADQREAAVGPGGYFRVGVGETTKSVQGFRIPGLTWIDSPGLHSVTPENGALASDYADVADLIIYPMHTGNPGRTGDIIEIRELLRAKKRFLLVITQCDRSEEDETPDGTIVQEWIMKDMATRKGQIDYVRSAIDVADNAAPLDILCLSVRYAETHGNTPAALEESGVSDFFRLLTDIARSEGVRNKRETPSRNLDHFVTLVLGANAYDDTLSVVRVQERLRNLEKELAVAEVNLDRRADRVTAAVLGRIGVMVAEKVQRHAGNKDQASFERECIEALRQIVAEETRIEIRSLLTGSGGAIMPQTNLAGIADFLKFESFTVKIPKSNKKTFGAVGEAGGAAAGMWTGAELGAIAGSVIPGPGNVIGGILGVLIGGFIGSAVGNGAGQALGSDWEESMQSGDNRAEVEASTVKALQDAGRDAVQRFFARVKSAAITSVGRRADRLDHELARFSDILKRKVHSNGRSVPTRV